jgi:uncharacterized membrane protein (DUF2068 family)
MTPQNHNKILAVIYGVIGVLALTGLLVITMKQITITVPVSSESSQVVQHFDLSSLSKKVGPYLPILLPPMLQLVTAYGLFMKRRWGRVIALVFSALFVLLFPLGTGLAIYTWWFLQSEAGRQIYPKASELHLVTRG